MTVQPPEWDHWAARAQQALFDVRFILDQLDGGNNLPTSYVNGVRIDVGAALAGIRALRDSLESHRIEHL